MSIKRKSHRSAAIFGAGVLATAALLALAACSASFERDGNETPDSGIVRDVVAAPVAPDGDVAGATTDLVLNLDVSPDPDQPSVGLRAGDQVRVTLPDAFEKRRELPLVNVFDCIEQYPRCNTIVLLLGWPQGALGAPPPLGYKLRREGSHTLVMTATQDLIPNPPTDPGLKQIHLLLNGVTNPPPGRYPIGVEIVTSDGRAEGAGQVNIRAKTRPAIAVTNTFHENFANGNFQTTAPDSLTALPFDLLLWNDEGAPLEGITIEGDRLLQDNTVVGRVSIEAPDGAVGQHVATRVPSSRVDAPVTGIPAGHLRVFFRAGSETGAYGVRFALNGGNAVRQVVAVK